MIIYFDKQCQKLIYRVSVDGKPVEFFSLEMAVEAIAGVDHEQA